MSLASPSASKRVPKTAASAVSPATRSMLAVPSQTFNARPTAPHRKQSAEDEDREGNPAHAE